MRYTRVGVASYAIASALVVTVLGVAWARSQGRAGTRAITESSAEVPAAEAPGGPAPPPQESGAAAYEAECGGCHRDGEARGRSIPALRGHAVTLFTSEGGREYLIDLMIDGRVRFVESARTVYEETHPSYEELADATIAAILNHMLVSWGNENLLPTELRLYTAAEVAAQRARR
jgi:cytochrome c5